MTTPVSTASAEHYTWGDGCDGWHLVRAPGLSVIEERMPPGTAEARHRHAAARQLFYVLEGELQMEVEGVVHTLGARTALEIAPGVAHQARNASAADVRFLVVSQPPSHGDRTPA
jgi:mannose-6-phosphate isomerase-like protein (cupin superfamily)